MNSTLLKRLFRVISETPNPDLTKIARLIVDDEKTKGHEVLAQQLEQIIAKPVASTTSSVANKNGLGVLPTSKRDQSPLVTLVPPEELRHHMVLPADVEQRFARVECEFAARDRLALYGLQARKKILLYGPPGCGKSLGAERLAWNTGLPLLRVRFDAIMSSYFGESAVNLRAVFETASEFPCLLFLDECDFVARSRTQGNDVGEAPRIVNILLQLLEDYRAPGLLVAATNLDQSLDSAIFRRFDDVFEVPAPGKEEIDKLLHMTLSSIELSPDIDWPRIIVNLHGMSAANVVKAAQDAAKTAVLSGSLPVNQHHITSAISELRRNVD